MSSLRIPLTSRRKVVSLQLEISSLDTQIHGNQSRLLQMVLLKNITTKGTSLMLSKLLCTTSTLCKVGSILKGLWSLLYNSLKQRQFQSSHKMIQHLRIMQVQNLHANIAEGSYMTRNLTSIPSPCKLTSGCKHSNRWVKVRGHLLLRLVICKLGPIIALSLHPDGSLLCQ